LSEAVEKSVHIIETRFPDPLTAERYDAYYQVYRSTYFALQPVFEQASRIGL
jgi:sugar (pentulose or hexulose) kinase